MNNYFNFKIPEFNEKFGEDWGAFKAIIDDNVDYIINKTIDLYRLRDISVMPIMAVEASLRTKGIRFNSTDTTQMKKLRLRKFNTTHKSKATASFYLDIAEALVGTRGVVYNGYVYGTFIHDTSIWPDPDSPTDKDWVWSTSENKFQMYIDVKTTNNDLLDTILSIYRQPDMLSAFYVVFLIDSTFNILRSV
jgi:hypothetical protein